MIEPKPKVFMPVHSLGSSTMLAEIFQKRKETLKKVCLLEIRKGFKNTAVTGGLDKMITNVSATIIGISEVEQLKEGQKYSSLTLPERKHCINKILEIMSDSVDTSNGIAESEQNIYNTVDRSKYKAKLNIKTKVSYEFNTPLSEVSFLNKRLIKYFIDLKFTVFSDLLWFLPTRHQLQGEKVSINKLQPGGVYSVIGKVVFVETYSSRNTVVKIADNTGKLSITWFKQPYIAKKISVGEYLFVSGKTSVYRGKLQMENSNYESIDSDESTSNLANTSKLIPIYPVVLGFTSRYIRANMCKVLDALIPNVEEFLPKSIIQDNGLFSFVKAIREYHFPKNPENLEKARFRLAFDELLIHQTAILQAKMERKNRRKAVIFKYDSQSGSKLLLNDFKKKLNFTNTKDQDQVLEQILKDLQRDSPMERLIQGEVGSGKTILALYSLLICTANSFQGALLTPTEILAEQHFLSISQIMRAVNRPYLPEHVTESEFIANDKNIKIGLLTAGLKSKEKRQLEDMLSSNAINIIIGTHALIQERLKLPKLGMVVIDEQHRFGVSQRQKLFEREITPHMLALSATPIPRTLQLTTYGDLDISILREIPTGKRNVKTEWVSKDNSMKRIYNEARAELKKGHQVFVVCPLIEHSEVLQCSALEEEFKNIASREFSDYKSEMIHGRMDARSKHEVMQGFKNGTADVLFATQIIEVGVDIPNATYMIILGADRFGMAQLHQLRGRVGRAGLPSKCVLFTKDAAGSTASRLNAIVNGHDGFELAEKDLEIRGPGDYIGTRQSGFPDAKIAKPTDLSILFLARKTAQNILNESSDLSSSQYKTLAEKVKFIRQQSAISGG